MADPSSERFRAIGPVRGTLWAIAAAIAAGASGCAPPLFPTDAPRTQFDGYDYSRGEDRQQYVFDEFGRRQVNLRGRLLTGG